MKDRVERKKPHQSKILYPKKVSIKNEGEIKTFIEKQKLREPLEEIGKSTRILVYPSILLSETNRISRKI